MSDKTREAFERHIGVQEPRRILFRRGGSVFAEDVPEADYVDSGIQHRWKEWKAAWQASRAQALNEAAQLALEKTAMFPSDSDYVRGYALAKNDFVAAIRSLGSDVGSGRKE